MDLEVEDEDAKYCSACLAVNVKMILLQKNNLFEVFESITKKAEKKAKSIPQYLCYICLALLKKCAKFHTMCLQTQQLLDVLKEESIAARSRHLLKIPLNLAVTETEQVGYIPDDADKETAPEIKVEYPLEFQQLESDVFDTNFSEDREESPVDIKMFVEKGHLDEIKVLDDPEICESDLDEPLAVLKTGLLRKALTEPTKKKVLKKTVKKSTKSIKNKEIQENLKPVAKKRKAKFNKYNEKFEEDFEEFCNTHNVDVVFLTKEQQIERMKVKYEDNKYRLRCEHCFAGFMTDTAFEKHSKWHDPSAGPFVCDVCQLRYKSKPRLQRHLRFHRKEFICKLCSKTLANSHLAMQHHRWHEGFKHECKHCNKKFNVVSSHLNHVREQHTPVRCQDCGESFEGTIRLKRHRDSTHCECKSCHVVFRNARVLARHVEAGCRPDLLPCKTCGASFPDEQSQMFHAHRKYECRENNTTRRYKCEACPSTFSTDRARGAHWASVHMGHHNIRSRGKRGRPAETDHGATETEDGSLQTRSYLCELCAKSFKSIINLKQHHSTVHLDERPYKCHLCPKAFAGKCRLAVHINIHTGDRPYQCKQCPERFKSYSQRYKHRLLVHEKDRPYKCSQCPKDYVLLYDLKSHIRYSHLHQPRPPRKNPRRRANKVVP